MASLPPTEVHEIAFDALVQYTASIDHATPPTAAVSEPVLEKLKEYAIKFAPDYPGVKTLSAWENLYAIVTCLEGTIAANKDLHKLLAEEAVSEPVREYVDAGIRQKLCAAITTPAAPLPEPLTDIELQALVICRADGRVSVSKIQRVLAIGYNEAGEICQSIISKGQCDELEISPSLSRNIGAKEQ
jgi:hypothetical protein